MRRIRRRIAASALGLGIAFVVPELLIRWGPWEVPEAVVAAIDTKSNELFRPHSKLRYCLAADVSLQQTCSEYNIYEVRTGALGVDAIGFRLGGFGSPPHGVVVGDSFAMSVGTSEEETLVAHLSRGLGLSLVNLGVPGYGPQQARRMVFDYGVALHPPIVIWVFFGNDLVDAQRFADSSRSDGEVPIAWKRTRSFINTYWATYKFYRYRVPFHSRRREHWRGPKDLEYVFTYDLLNELDFENPSVRSGLDLLRHELEEFAKGAGPHGYQPVFVLMPFKEQTYESELRTITRRNLAGVDLQRVYRAVTELGGDLGIPTLDLTAALKAARSEQIYLRADPHLSPRGNQVAARAITDFIRSNRLLR
jgi:hypothetical protein